LFAHAIAPATAADAPAALRVNWKIIPLIGATVRPNFQAGFGPIGGAGSGQTPEVGSSAKLNGGTVDFGKLVAGFEYLYKYAAQVSVSVNDTSGCTVYAEASSNLTGGAQPFPLAGVLFYLPTSTSNSPFSPSKSFSVTTARAESGGANIAYAGAPPSSAMISSSSTGEAINQGYDFQLRLPDNIPPGTLHVTIVYTVIEN
jgi:hypothetical protein